MSLVWEQTQQLIQHPELVFEEYSRRAHSKRKGALDLTTMIIKKKKELHTQELEKKRLIDLYQTGIISLEEITPRLDRIRDHLKNIEQEYRLLEEEKHREQKQLQLIEQFSTFRDKFLSRLGELTFEEKNKWCGYLSKKYSWIV